MTVPQDPMRTEAEAIEHAKRSPPARAAQELLGWFGIAVVGDQLGQRFLAFAEGELAELEALAVRNGAGAQELAMTRNLAAVMRRTPGARRSEMMIDFPGLGYRFASLVPLEVAMKGVLTRRAHAHAFGPRSGRGGVGEE